MKLDILNMTDLPLHFKVEKDGTVFHAWCPELPGCHTHGESVVIALKNLKEATQLYIDFLLDEELKNCKSLSGT